MSKNIENEILELHRLFQAWYQGSLDESELNVKIGDRLADYFYIVYPDASKHSKQDLLSMMKVDRGNDVGYKIDVNSIQIRPLSESCYLASYQEWQFWNGEIEPGLKIQTTAILRKVDENIKWEVIHETEMK